MAGTWQPLTNQPPFQANTMLLLTDGSVFVNGYLSTQCWKLVPDSDGSYVNGNWVRLADMLTTRLYYASAVLGDGRVFVAGGEYSAYHCPGRLEQCWRRAVLCAGRWQAPPRQHKHDGYRNL